MTVSQHYAHHGVAITAACLACGVHLWVLQLLCVLCTQCCEECLHESYAALHYWLQGMPFGGSCYRLLSYV